MPIPSNKSKASNKSSKGDTSRTSSQGRKLASGGNTDLSNQGHSRGVSQQRESSPVTARKGK